MAATTTMAPSASTPMLASVQPQETKRDWHASTALPVRRRVLLQILLLLKTKYGKVDKKISYIARRAELALYTQAFSALEYRNPKTLHRRLHSLVVKLHMNNLAAQEHTMVVGECDREDPNPSTDTPTSTRPLPPTTTHTAEETNTRKRMRITDSPAQAPAKRPRDSTSAATSRQSTTTTIVSTTTIQPIESAIFFDGNSDLLRLVCSFMGARDSLQLASTSTLACAVVPPFIPHIRVAVRNLELLSPAQRGSFFARFPNLETLEVVGDAQSHLHFDFHDHHALVRRNVVCRSLVVALARQPPMRKLTSVRWLYAFVDGVQDRITGQIADVLLDAAQFPRLQELSLVGNAVSDDGVAYLCAALRRLSEGSSQAIKLLNLEQNFVGERGHELLQELLTAQEQSQQLRRGAGNGTELKIKLRGNLMAAAH